MSFSRPAPTRSRPTTVAAASTDLLAALQGCPCPRCEAIRAGEPPPERPSYVTTLEVLADAAGRVDGQLESEEQIQSTLDGLTTRLEALAHQLENVVHCLSALAGPK